MWFYNQAVLRAFEKIAGIEAICPDIAGIMGAFGAALLAKKHDHGGRSTMLSFDEIASLTYTTSTTRCQGCFNHCMLTINRFDGNRLYISGNRCEKGLGANAENKQAPNVIAYKQQRMFAYPPLKDAPRGVIGIPRVLNLYENYPF